MGYRRWADLERGSGDRLRTALGEVGQHTDDRFGEGWRGIGQRVGVLQVDHLFPCLVCTLCLLYGFFCDAFGEVLGRFYYTISSLIRQ